MWNQASQREIPFTWDFPSEPCLITRESTTQKPAEPEESGCVKLETQSKPKDLWLSSVISNVHPLDPYQIFSHPTWIWCSDAKHDQPLTPRDHSNWPTLIALYCAVITGSTNLRVPRWGETVKPSDVGFLGHVFQHCELSMDLSRKSGGNWWIEMNWIELNWIELNWMNWVYLYIRWGCWES